MTLNFAQAAQGQDDVKGFEVPDKYAKVLLVNDPNCPIQLIGPAKIIGYDNGSLLRGYRMQNISGSVVKAFKVRDFNWLPKTSYSGFWDNENFLPFLTYSTLTEDQEFNLKPFKKESLVKLEITDKICDIWVVMITFATLTDGTEYNAVSKYKQIQNFIDELDFNKKMSAGEVKSQEEKLNSFIADTMRSKD